MQPELVVHYEVEVLGDTLCQPLCENNEGIDAFENLDDEVEMTDDPGLVTCSKCLHYLQYGPPDDA